LFQVYGLKISAKEFIAFCLRFSGISWLIRNWICKANISIIVYHNPVPGAIVTTEVGGIRGILKNRATGMLVPPQNPSAMAEKIGYLLQHPEERKRLGAAAQEESRKYSLERHVACGRRSMSKQFQSIDSDQKNENLKIPDQFYPVIE
jgi:glycosyltransferase involved in cell wall biosynthesis